MSQPILFVDDNEFDRQIVNALIEKLQFPSRLAKDGFEALELMTDEETNEKFSLFIIDLQMPNMTGLQLLKRIKANPNLKDVPCLIMSGRDQPSDIAVATSLGAADYIVKPVDIDVLEEKIKNLTSGASNGWVEYPIPEANSTCVVTTAFTAKLKSFSEMGATLINPEPLEKDTFIHIGSGVLKITGTQSLRAKILHCEASEGSYLVKIAFVGINEAIRKQLRLLGRKVWADAKQ